MADWEGVVAWGKGGCVVRFEYIFGCLYVDELLGLDALDDGDGVGVLLVSVPLGEIVQPFEEECRFHVFEKFDVGECGDGGGGDVERRGPVRWASTCYGGDGLRIAGKNEGRG